MCQPVSRNACGCGCQEVCASLWSKGKKIRVLEQKLKSLDDQKEELKTLIQELKDEK